MATTLRTGILREAGIGVALAAIVGTFASWLYFHGGGYVVQQGPYFGADVFRVRENLLHPFSEAKSYFRLSVHPLFGLICVAAQLAQKLTGLSDYNVYALLAFVNGALFGGLLYLCARVWGASIPLALAIVAFSCSTAGFIYWTSITETHPWAGVSLLLLIAMVRWDPRSPEMRTLWFGAAFTASFSILVTTAMAWLFSRLPFDRVSLREAVRAFVRESTAVRIAGELLAGLGLTLLGYTATRMLLHGAKMGPLLSFGSEKQFVTAGFAYPFNGFNIFGLLGPRLDYATSVTVFANAGFGLLACLSFFLVPARLRFLPIFLVFALLFHSNFVRFQAFLFAVDYTAAAVLVVGLALGARLQRRAAIVLFVLSVPLAIVNVTGFFDAVAQQAAGHGSKNQMLTVSSTAASAAPAITKPQ